MILTAEQKCLLWLSNAEVTPGHVQTLLQTYGSVEEIREAFSQLRIQHRVILRRRK